VPVSVYAVGSILIDEQKQDFNWARVLYNARTSDAEAREVKGIIKQCYQRIGDGEEVVLPVIAYYGAGRGWLPSRQRLTANRETKNNLSSRWAAFYDCLNERIRFPDIDVWFKREAGERGNRNGQWRPGFNAVRWALLQCVPGLSELWFDYDLDQMAFNINGQSQPFENLSAGQRMMVALVADIAIKMVTQNAHLVPSQNTAHDNSDECPLVLKETPGLVLVDELDVHLHPSWQRRIATDLKRTFPRIQFVCTTHSPQLVGELEPHEVILLSDTGQPSHPERSLGLDSNHVLEEIMGASPLDQETRSQRKTLNNLIDKEDLDGAKRIKEEMVNRLGHNHPEVLRAGVRISFLEVPPTET